MRDYLTRRKVIGAIGTGSLVACAPQVPESYSALTERAIGTFAHGIASGDPTANSVILWTRITPDNPRGGSVDVTWEVSETESFNTLAASGTFATNSARNWTVKVDATRLMAGRQYAYRFKVGAHTSPMGLTKTLPDGALDKARFAVVSCSNWQHGYFNAYDHIARQDHFDALIHLGDYYYEYGADYYLNEDMRAAGRLHEPRHEIITLDDYRMRHAQYRSDPALQAVTAKMPLITIWDDHETSNDSWRTGADNHDEGEGDWEARKEAALRAYYEWMPIRDPRPGRLKEDIFRAYEYGDLLTLVTLETRLLARNEPIVIDDYFSELRENGADDFKANVLNDPNRNMLGQTQLDFIASTLRQSKAAGKPWRMLANQVLMGKLHTPDMAPYVNEEAMVAIEQAWAGVRQFVELSKYNLPVYPDSWDGYPVARETLYSRLKTEGVEDILVVTGDAHEFWVNDLRADDDTKLGVELCTTSVSSETLRAFMGEGVADYALLLTQSNADVRYYNALHNGYLDLELTPHSGKARMVGISTVAQQDYDVFDVASFTVKPQKNSLTVSQPKGLNLKQRALFSGLG